MPSYTAHYGAEITCYGEYHFEAVNDVAAKAEARDAWASMAGDIEMRPNWENELADPRIVLIERVGEEIGDRTVVAENLPFDEEPAAEPATFQNQYTCYKCKHEWTDEYDACPDDDCPECGARHVSPHTSITLKPAELPAADADKLTLAAELAVRASQLYAITFRGWTVRPVSLYDEEGVEGWLWTEPNGTEHAEIGDHSELPTWPASAARALKGGATC